MFQTSTTFEIGSKAMQYDRFGNIPGVGKWASADPKYVRDPRFEEELHLPPEVRRERTQAPDFTNIETLAVWSFVKGNPVKYVDLTGKEAYVLIDREGAGGRGHTAIVVGNKDQGYSLMTMGAREGGYSKAIAGSAQEGVGIIQGKTLESVLEKSFKLDPVQIYDKALRLETSPAQDQKMLNYGVDRSQQEINYSVFTNNCGDFVRGSLEAGGVGTERHLAPNTYYDQVKSSMPSATEYSITQGN
ncbi:MAG: hypothetical protein IT285_13880 [Bdellovibrionales bacterium]|nr:hypothetical protein [Bdellovibrionales bacterium]